MPQAKLMYQGKHQSGQREYELRQRQRHWNALVFLSPTLQPESDISQFQSIILNISEVLIWYV